MPLEKDLNLLSEVNRLMKSRYDEFQGTYFFGSRLKGTESPDSDYDLVLIFDRKIDYSFKREVRSIIYDLMLRYDIVIDAKIFPADELLRPQMPFTEEVKNHGYFYGLQ